MIAVTESAEGAVLPVRARPGAKHDRLLDEFDGALRVAVTAAPEAGKANEAIIRVLADSLDLRRSQIELISGATSRAKRFRVSGLCASELLSRIAAVLEPTPPPDPSRGDAS